MACNISIFSSFAWMSHRFCQSLVFLKSGDQLALHENCSGAFGKLAFGREPVNRR